MLHVLYVVGNRYSVKIILISFRCWWPLVCQYSCLALGASQVPREKHLQFKLKNSSLMRSVCPEFASTWLLYSTSCIINKIIFVLVKMVSNINGELPVVFKLNFMQRTIQKRCLNSGQIDVNSMECFGLSHRHFFRGTHECADGRRLYSQATVGGLIYNFIVTFTPYKYFSDVSSCQVPCVGISVGIERIFSILEAQAEVRFLFRYLSRTFCRLMQGEYTRTCTLYRVPCIRHVNLGMHQHKR